MIFILKNINNIIKNIPKPIIPLLGPKIIYSSCLKIKVADLLNIVIIYTLNLNITSNIFDLFIRPRSHQLIEYQMLPNDYDQRNKYDESKKRIL